MKASPRPFVAAPFDGLSEPAIAWRGDLQPVPLHRSRVVVTGRRSWAYNVEADKVYRSELRFLWLAARLGRSPLAGDVAVRMTFAGRRSTRSRIRPDLTNLLKAVEDAANPDLAGGWRGLWVDDRQVRVLVGEITGWAPDVRPQVTLEVWTLA
jgi:Holliday junction resolvase RusA-like endonuclease